MGKRKYSGYTAEFKKKVTQLLSRKDSNLELRPFKKFFPSEGYKTIWIREDEGESHKEYEGYIYCDNMACRHKKTADRVRLKLIIFALLFWLDFS